MRFTVVVVLACACAGPSATSSPTAASSSASSAVASASGPAASAILEPRSGSTVSGTAKFVPAADGLGVHVEVQGATPGKHGVHFYEPEEFGVDPATVRSEFRPYIEHFGLKPE